MAGERTFVVKILGNADGAITAFKKLGREGSDALGAVFDVAKKGALIATAAAGAIAGAALTAIAAATADQESQKKLADQLRRTMQATDDQIKSVEEFVSKQQLLVGVSDDELRPALASLARATGDITFAQKNLGLALDISAATGIELETVSLALGKAFSGNIGALTKLGVPIDENVKKSKDLSSVVQTLNEQFGGAAAAAANTFSGRLKILKLSIGEAVEGIGYALLPIAEKLVAFIQTNVVPVIQAFADELSGGGSLRDALLAAAAQMGDFGIKVIDVVETVVNSIGMLGNVFIDLVKPILFAGGGIASLIAFVRGGPDAFNKVGLAMNNFIDGLDNLKTNSAVTGAAFDRFRDDLFGVAAAATITQAELRALDQVQRGMAAGGPVQAFIGPMLEGYGSLAPKVKTAAELQADFNKKLKELQLAGSGSSNALKTLKELTDKYRSSVEKVTSEQKSLIAATKGITEAKKQLGDRVKDLADREADVGERNLDLVKRQGDVVKRNIDIVKRKGDLEKREQDVGERNLDLLKRQGDVVKRNLEVAKRKGEVDKRNTEIIKREGDLVKRNTELAERQLDVTKRGNELAESNINLAEAQEKFNAAVRGYGKDSIQAKEAQSELAEAQRNVEQSGYRVERAVFAIKEAEEELKAVRMDSASTVQDIRRAEIDLAEAKLNLAEAQANQSELNKEQTDSLLKLNQTISGAVKGNKEYDKLFDKLEDAQNDQLKATEALTQASEDLVDAQDAVAKAAQDIIDAREDAAAAAQDVIGAEEDVADAIKAVLDAQQDIIDAKQAVVDARQAIIDAEEDLADAIRDVSKAQKDIVDAKQAVIDAQDEIAEAHDKVREAVEEEAEAYRQLAIAIKKAQDAAAAAGKKFAAPTFSAPTAVAAAILPTSGRVDPSIIPVLPPVPVPAASVSTATAATPATTIVVNTGVGTNGIEAGRQIVQLLQQYTAVDAFAIDKLGFAPRR